MKRRNPFCLGYGPFEGTCENRAGTSWGPYWCSRCHQLRLEAIDKSLRKFVASFQQTDVKDVGRGER